MHNDELADGRVAVHLISHDQVYTAKHCEHEIMEQELNEHDMNASCLLDTEEGRRQHLTSTGAWLGLPYDPWVDLYV